MLANNLLFLRLRPRTRAGLCRLVLALLFLAPAGGAAVHAEGRAGTWTQAAPAAAGLRLAETQSDDATTAKQPAIAAPQGDAHAPAADKRAKSAAEPKPEADDDDAAEAPTRRNLPPPSVTEHTLELPGRTLHVKATAGALPLFDADFGKRQAEVAYVAFTLNQPGAPSPSPDRPLTFLFNGGPGAASAYLNIGALGPWRLPLDGATPSAPTALVPDAETWLDFTDLVFIDPPGTGYSRIIGGEETHRQFWSVDGDADAIAVFIRKWIAQAGRQRSVKFLVGESYGGTRALKVARTLEQSQGIGVRGLVLISPVLDFVGIGGRSHAPMTFVQHLPSMAATRLELNGKFDRAALAPIEAYAEGDYLADLLRGPNDDAAIERMSTRLAALTGLDKALVKRLGARIDTATFQRELYRGRGLVGSAYDATITAFDPTPMAFDSQYPDPVLDGTRAPLTTAMTEFYRNTLKWRVDQRYRLLNGETAGRWSWGRHRGGFQVVDDLRTVLASDRHTQVMIAHGASDLVTPYFANKMILDQLPVYGSPARAQLNVYGGGHMFYSRDGSRRELRSDAEALYRAALSPEPTGE